MTYNVVSRVQKNISAFLLLVFILFISSNGTTQETVPQKTGGAPSIFFLIDHSGSMFNNTGGVPATDQWRYRFIVTRNFIDSVKVLCPDAEIGIAVFRQFLYFDPVDDDRFVKCPEQDSGAYLPLFKLDSTYVPDGKMGYQILQDYLETDTVNTGISPYVDLTYVPTNTATNSVSTNINAAFNAARHAMLSSSYPKDNQYIIFFSDGLATWPNDGTQDNYVQGTGVPTTFTVFFTPDLNPPVQLVEMTNNIKNNGYSVTNPASNLWAFHNTSYDSLMNLLIKNVLGTIVDDKVPELIPYPSPTYERRPILTWHVPQVIGTSYTIQISQTSDFASPIVNVPVVDTFYTSQIDLPHGSIFWRVKSDISTWSKSSSFVILDNRVPVLIPHASPTEILQPTLRWHKPPGTVSVYTIQVSSFPAFDPILIETPVIDTFYTCQAPLPIGAIYWRVKGDDSDYSPAGTFVIKDNRIPKLIGYVPEITGNATPLLKWHPVPTATAYTIDISNKADFSALIISVPVADTTYTPTVALPVGDIYWRVKSNLVDLWSDVDHFYIQSANVPFLIRYNGQQVGTVQPVFRWHPVATATAYKILIADNTTFTNAITVPLADTVYTPQVGLGDGMWYWKVSCSINPDAYSPVDSLEIDSTITPVTGSAEKPVHKISCVPFKNSIRILFQGQQWGDINADIYDFKGRYLFTKTLIQNKQNEMALDIPIHISSGIYLLRIKSNEKVFNYKLAIPR